MNNVNDQDMNHENTRSSLCSCNSGESLDTTENEEKIKDINTENQKAEGKQGTFIYSRF